jgi:hypothetical protein
VRFSDLPAGHWAKDPAELLATAGLLSGYADGTFRPNIKLTREHFSMMLLAAKNIYAEEATLEVGGRDWQKDPQRFVTRREAAKLIGSGDISRPQDIITRGEMAALLAKTSFGKAAIKRLPLK